MLIDFENNKEARFTMNGQALSIGHLPGRKSVCLALTSGNRCRVLAHFRDPADAQLLVDFLAQIAYEPE